MQAIEARIEAEQAANRPEAILFRQVSETLDAASAAAATEPWDHDARDKERKAIDAKIAEHGPRLEAAFKRRDRTRQILSVMMKKLTEDIFWAMEPYWTLVQNDDWSASLLFTVKTELDRTYSLIRNKYAGANSFTLDWAFGIWEAQSPRPPQTVKEVRNHLDAFIAFSNVVLVEEARRKHLTDWRQELQNAVLKNGTPMAAKTINQRLHNVMMILRVAWREMEIPGFNTTRIALGNDAKTQRQDWKDDEVLAVMRGIEPGSDLAVLFALGLVYGPRIGEFMSVVVDDISIRPDLMWINLRAEYTKTRAERSIVVIDALRPALERLIAQRKKGEYLLDIRRPKNPDLKIGHEASKIFRRLTKKLGVDRLFHELRHTLKSNARRVEGVQQVDIDRICGHAPANVGAIYGHGSYMDLKRTAERVYAAALTPEMHEAFRRMVIGPE